MDRNNVLKFQVAIEDQASKGLEEIEKNLNGIVDKFKSSVGGINAELGKIGQTAQMPNIAEGIRQIDQLKESLKKDTDNIPLFKNVLEQMQQLQNFIGKNTLGSELDKMKNSLNRVFGEIPKVDNNSFTAYFNQLNKAYNDFMAKFGTQRTQTPNLLSIGESMQKMSGLAGNDTLLREYQAQAEQIKATIINTIKETNTVIEATRKLIGGGGSLNFDTINKNIDATASAILKLKSAFEQFNGVVDKEGKLSNMMTGMGEIIKSVKFSMSSLKEGQENLNWGKTMTENAKSVIQARSEMERLVPLVEKLKTQQLISKNLGLDTSNIDTTIQRVQHLQQLLMSITAHGGFTSTGVENLNGLNASQLMAAYKEHLVTARNDLATQSQANTQALKNEAQAQKENELSKRQTAQANAQLSQEENRLSQAIQQTANSAHGQSQVISDLKSMAMQYLSIWGAQQFVTDMANITGELELQKKSLEVILNSASAAQQMYSEIRDLSQMSPYTFEDLLKSHRQLAAFGIEAKDVFGTLKSLSDIGAGLDVDVSRLILAFGHTKSYGYLSGIQNRQFETAGIDMIGALTEKYNKLAAAEERAGRQAEFVTRRDIFSKMRDRSIPFEDVQDVILDLDRPGGKFYNMQIRQFETLGGKLRNLRNNYRIMMSELGEDNKGFLMGTVGIINNLTENWQRYARVLKGVALGYGAMKLAAMLAGKSALAANKEIAASTVARNSIAGTTANLNGTMSTWRAMGSSRKIFGGGFASSANDNEVRNIAKNKEINNLTKQRIALTGKLTEAQRAYLLQSAGISGVESRRIALLSNWRRGLMSVRLGMIAVAQSAKAMAVALLTNPMTWIMVAVAGLTALIDKMGETSEQAEELKNTLKEGAETDIQGIRQSTEQFVDSKIVEMKDTNSFKNSYGTAIMKKATVNEGLLEDFGVDTVFEELDKALQSHSPLYEGDYFDIVKAEGQAGQVKAAFDKLNDIDYAKQIRSITQDRIGNAVDKTGGWNDWGTEGLETNMKDFSDYYSNLVNNLTINDAEWNRLAARDKQNIENYARQLGLSRKEALAKYMFEDGFKFGNEYYGSTHDADVAKDALKTAKNDMQPLASEMSDILKESFSGNMDAGIEYVQDVLNQIFSQAKIGNEEVKAHLSEEFYELLIQSMRDAGNTKDADSLEQILMERIAGTFLMSSLKKNISPKTTQKEMYKSVSDGISAAIEAAKKKSKKFLEFWNKLGKEGQKKFVAGLKGSGLNYSALLMSQKDWQTRALAMKLKLNLQTDVDYTEFIKKQRETIKKAQEILLSNKSKIKWALGVEVNLDVRSVGDADKLLKMFEAQKKVVEAQRKKYARDHRGKDGYIHNPAELKVYNELKSKEEILALSIEQAKEMKRSLEYLKSEHQSYIDPKTEEKRQKERERAKNRAEAAKRKAEAAARKADRDWMNRERHYIQSLGEAYRMYKMWYKDLRSEPAAIKRVRDAYGNVLENSDFKDITSIAGYQSLLNKEREKVSNHKFNYNGDMADEKKSFITDLTKTVNELFHDSFSESSEKFTSDMEKTLERITDAFKTFEEVLKATGDDNLADSITNGLTGLFGGNVLVVERDKAYAREEGEDVTKVYMPLENVADAFKNRMLENLTSITSRDFYGIHQFAEGQMATHEYLFDEKASKEEIERRVGFLFNIKNEDGKYDELMQKLIPAVNKLILEWQKLAKEEREKAIKLYSDSINKLSDYKSIASRNNADYNTSISSNNLLERLGLISKEEKDMANRRAEGIRDEQNFKATVAFSKYFGNVLAMTRKEAIKTAKVLKNQLNEKLATGRVSASEYAKEMQKIQDVLDKKKQNTFFGSDSDIATFIKGGIPALQKKVQGQIEDKRSELAKLYENSGLSKEEIDKKINENGDLEKLLGESDSLSGMESGLMDMSLGVSLVTGTLDGLNEAAKSLSDMFDALGDEGKANLWSDVSDTIGGITSIFSPAQDLVQNATSGNIGGFLSSAISAPFKMIASPIAAFSRLHDKKIDRHIEKLKESVSRIEGYTEVIARAQERTLGYDKGDMIRMYQRQYAANQIQIKNIVGKARLTFNKEGAAGTAMANYYNSAGGEGVNGYQQQFNLLNQQRSNYIGMYNEEYSKKKKSAASLEEYKQKIAELDDKIMHFSEDLAKNLWGIDLKSWADQISDALANAFENGENAANAYKDAVTNIMRSVAHNILKLGILEPMFEKLRRKLFGRFDEKGNYIADGLINIKDDHAWDDPEKTGGLIMSQLADFMGDNGPLKKAMEAYQIAYTGLEKMGNDAGISFKNSSNKTLSSGIQGTSEETSALLAGYINALRQDVSYIRLMQTQFINEAFPDYVKQITGMGTTLGRIDANVAAIRSIISENGALYEKVERLSDDMHNVILGNQKFHIA